MKKMNKGFTLIELLAVILILGIIALIAIPTVNSVITESKIGAWKATANQVVKSYQQYGQLQDLKADAVKVIAFAPSTDTGYTVVEGQTKVETNTGDTVKSVLEIKGDMPEKFETLALATDGDAYIYFVEDGVACWNYGSSSTEPTSTKGSSVDMTVGTFDMVCKKAS